MKKLLVIFLLIASNYCFSQSSFQGSLLINSNAHFGVHLNYNYHFAERIEIGANATDIFSSNREGVFIYPQIGYVFGSDLQVIPTAGYGYYYFSSDNQKENKYFFQAGIKIVKDKWFVEYNYVNQNQVGIGFNAKF